MMKVLSNFENINLRKFSWEDSFETQKFDSLTRTVLIVGIEQEFNTVFEDNVFDNFRNLEEILVFLQKDIHIF